ncbi:hypothetical protein [Corynebacterium anserum]|uniref:Uncharacterized protein n=1 Tax=Corynebacterium anserum TaxID=2684406 RepID=A0A7G7YPW3_9CORY|nr:hypothetical protein [Corynebacterium anserum]QNH96533.1 hypothetical protein GP473_07570 [Corynebacterium anserum]
MTKSNSSQDFGDFSELLAEDRVLDAIGRGEYVDSEAHPLYALLSSARAEADANMPEPPVLADLLEQDGSSDTATPATQARGASITTLVPRRYLKFGRNSVAAGGVSITTMLIASGVAAALAVGGLGYAAYKGSIPLPLPNKNVTVHTENDQTGSSESQRGSSKTSTTGDSTSTKPGGALEESERPAESESETPQPTEATTPLESTTGEAAPIPSDTAQQPTDTAVPTEQPTVSDVPVTGGNVRVIEEPAVGGVETSPTKTSPPEIDSPKVNTVVMPGARNREMLSITDTR